MKRYHFLKIVAGLLVLGHFVSCERPTDSFERNSHKDPLNKNYETGTASNLTLFNDYGTIVISWEDTAKFEDGFIIEKSLVDTSSFKEIGRVEADKTIFRDSSKKVRKDTYYRVSAFMSQEDEVQKTESSIQKVVIGDITDYSLNFRQENNTLDIQWESYLPFNRKYRLYISEKNSHSYGLIGEFNSDVTSFTDDLDDMAFYNRNYKIELILVGDTFEDVIAERTLTLDREQFEPSDLIVTVQDEQTVTLNWNDNSFFEEGFRIFLNDQEIADVPANSREFVHSMDLTTENHYNFTLEAYANNSQFILEELIYYYIPTPYFTFDSALNSSATMHAISWDIADDKYVVEYILQRSLKKSGIWEEIGRFGKDIKETIISGIDPDEAYVYRIRTLSSESDVLNLYYVALYEKTRSIQAHDLALTSIKVDKINSYLATSSFFLSGGYRYGDRYIRVWDLNSMDLIHEIHEGTYIIGHDFSNDGKYVSTFMQRRSGNDVNLYQLSDGTLSHSLSDTAIEDLVFTGNDSTIYAVSGVKGDLFRYNFYTGSGEQLFTGESRVLWANDLHNIVISDDHRFLAMDGDDVWIFDAGTGRFLHQISTNDTRHPTLAISNDGNTLAYQERDKIHSYSSPGWTMKSKFDLAKRTYGRPISTDFKPGSDEILAVAYNYWVFVYNLSNGKLSGWLKTGGKIRSLKYLPDGSGFVIGRENGVMEKWNLGPQTFWLKLEYD